MFAHLRRNTSCSVLSVYHSKCQLHKNVASVNHLVNDENNKLDIPFAKARQSPFVQSSPFLENTFEGDAFLKRNLQRILPKDVSIYICKNSIYILYEVINLHVILIRCMSLPAKNCQHLVFGLAVTFTGKY